MKITITTKKLNKGYRAIISGCKNLSQIRTDYLIYYEDIRQWAFNVLGEMVIFEIIEDWKKEGILKDDK